MLKFYMTRLLLIFFWQVMSFISTKKEIYVHDDEHKDSLKVTIVN